MDLRKILLLLLPVFSMTGCAWLEKAKDSFTQTKVTPVMPEAPPRKDSLAENEDTESRGSIVPAKYTRVSDFNPAWNRTEVEQVSSSTSNWNEQLANSQVVATVNGSPILAGDILERYAPDLTKARAQATPQQLAEIRKSLIQRDIENHIERRLLVDTLRKSIPEKNLKLLDEHIDELFEEELERMKKGLKVQSRNELAEKLAEQGISLVARRDAFANDRMAVEFLAVKSKPTGVVGRPELLAYYESHREDYTKSARVKWQEIKIPFAKHGGREKTLALVESIRSELSDGASFAELAKKHSQGATATGGGHWGWIQKGSLANKELEQKMFTAPMQQLQAHVVENKDHFQIVRVVDRNETYLTPFHEVQDEIRKKLGAEARREMAKKVLEDLKKDADIWTIFDSPDESEVPPNEDNFFSPIRED